MKVDNVDVFVGDKLFDLYLGLGEVINLTATGAIVRFQNGQTVDVLTGGYIGGQKRAGFTRKEFITVPIGKEELVTKLLAVAGITLELGYN